MFGSLLHKPNTGKYGTEISLSGLIFTPLMKESTMNKKESTNTLKLLSALKTFDDMLLM